MDTYEIGVRWVIGVLFVGLFAISALDTLCDLFDLPSIGERVDGWSIANKWYAGALILMMGMFLAHFLLNPLPCEVPAPSPVVQGAPAPPSPCPPAPSAPPG